MVDFKDYIVTPLPEYLPEILSRPSVRDINNIHIDLGFLHKGSFEWPSPSINRMIPDILRASSFTLGRALGDPILVALANTYIARLVAVRQYGNFETLCLYSVPQRQSRIALLCAALTPDNGALKIRGSWLQGAAFRFLREADILFPIIPIEVGDLVGSKRTNMDLMIGRYEKSI